MTGRRRSIVTRIVGSLFLFSVFITTLVVVFAYLRVSGSLTQSIRDRLTIAVALKEGELRRMMDQQREAVEVVGRLPDVRRQARQLVGAGSGSEHAAAHATLAGLLTGTTLKNLGWREVLLLNARGGKVEFATEASHEGDFRPEDQFFTEGRSKTFVQNVYAWPVTLQPTLTIATPVLNDAQETIAVLAVHLSLDRMDAIVAEGVGLGKSGETYLIDRYNEFVSSQRFGRSDYPRGVHTDGIDAAIQGRNGSGMYRNYAGEPVVGVYRWLPDFDLAMIAEVSQAEALAPARRLGMAIAAAGLAGAALFMLGIYFLARRIARPILAIKDTALAVADGDLEAVAPVLSADEVGVLARAFNAMTARLRGYHGDLERQVAARTLELEGAKVAAERASLAKSAFLSSMSHELRTPLNAILGYAQLIEQGEDAPGENRRFAGKILLAGEHLLGLINDVLSVARIEEDRLELAPAPFDLRQLVLAVEDMLRVRAQAKGLLLEVVLDPTLPKGVLGDEGRLRQVLLNLLGNAVKFTARGKVTLGVTSTPTGRIRVEVADTGPGIAADEFHRLFTSFFQTDSGRRSKEGAGLGLYLSQAFVRLMGGEIQVNSVLGQGTTFSFELALPATDAAPAAPLGHRGFQLEPGQPLLSQLVVDDLEDNREVLAAFLAALGLSVRTAAEGKEGVEQWQAWHPDVVWMDMHMPVEDGYSATRRIRALEQELGLPRTPILGISASVFEQDHADVLAAGCDTLVHKPYREADLVQALSRHARLRFIEVDRPESAGPASPPNPALPSEWRRGFRAALAKGDLDGAATLAAALPDDQAATKGRLLELLREFQLGALEQLVPPPEAS